MSKQINYGFKTPVIELDQHIFGANNYGEIINPSGQYDSSLPPFEPQARQYETQGCTVYGTHNGAEILHKFKFSEDRDFEELYNYIDAGIDPNSGGDPHKVCESIRKKGMVDVPKYPFPETMDKLLSLLGKSQPEMIVDEAKKYLTKYKFNHVWVLQGYESKEQRITDIKEALKYGIVCVSVSAWFSSGDIYVDNGVKNNHWCVCYGWTERGWKIFDTYDHSTKIYSFDSRMDFAKLLFLQKGNFQQESNWAILNIFNDILEAIKKILKLDTQLIEETVKKPPLIDKFPPESLKIKYKWSTPEEARYSTRLICDELGLSLDEKNLICQVIKCESGFNTNAKNSNTDGTTDWGIIQANDYWYIGKGKPLASVDEALNNPEKCVRIMIQRYKEGGLKDWVCFKSGIYKKYKA